MNVKKRNTIVSYPYTLHNIELTNRCIMRCVMCPRTYAMTRTCGDMDVNIFKMIIDQYVDDNKDACNTHIWLHHFGESLLHPHFDECILYAYNKGLKPALSVNPIMLNDNISERLLNANPYLLYLSLDGYDEQSFAFLRGVSGKYEESKKNILSFLDRKITSKSSVQVFISAIQMRGNNQQLEDAELFWNSQAGVDKFFKKPFTDWNGEIAEINKLADSSTPPSAPCTTPFSMLTIAWDGTISPCCYDYNIKYPLGNIKESSIREVWNNANMQSLRKEFITRKVTNELCAPCKSGGILLNAMPRGWGNTKIFLKNTIKAFVKKIDGAINKKTGISIWLILRKILKN